MRKVKLLKLSNFLNFLSKNFFQYKNIGLNSANIIS